MTKSIALVVLCLLVARGPVYAGSAPEQADHGMVAAQEATAARIGRDVLRDGGSAVDAAVATAFALAVTHPAAGNIGGGGFMVVRPASGEPVAFDFREKAPAAAAPDMWLVDGQYDAARHHLSHLSVGVPGTVAGLHMAWKKYGKLPWRRLVEPAIQLASEGFVVTHGLAESLRGVLPRMKKHPASIAAFTNNGMPYKPGDVLLQADLARTLERIAEHGPTGFYAGETAELLAKEMRRGGGIITTDDLAGYRAVAREPIRGTYRGCDILSMPPPSSGGVAVIEMLNILEGYSIREDGFGSAKNLHRYAEVMRRAFADRALHLGDPDHNPDMPLDRLTSKKYADQLRQTIRGDRASVSRPDRFTWPVESEETTHLSVVDVDRNAVAMTYTLEHSYGSGIVVPGAGFLLNNEMGDFNPAAGLTTAKGLIGTPPNLTAPGKRMLSSMTPTIVVKDGQLLMVTGSPGGRTIINTVVQTIVNVVDHQMNAQEAVDAGRMHHQWLPDRMVVERQAFSPDTLAILKQFGHRLSVRGKQGSAQVIVLDAKSGVLQGGSDRRRPDGAAAGY